jgi:phospholipase C
MMNIPSARRLYGLALTSAFTVALAACNSSAGSVAPQGAGTNGLMQSSVNGTASLSDVQHIVVIYQENWSFDSLYGKFPGANGYGPKIDVPQNAWNGPPLQSAPQPLNSNGNPDKRFPATIPLQTYLASKYVPNFDKTGDIIHRFYHEQYQIDNGQMDKFVDYSDNGGLVLSEYNAVSMPEGRLAGQYVLADNFFHSAFGGSFLNHQFLICACAPKWPNAPANYISVPSKDPSKLNDNHVTPDFRVVNTSYTTYDPHPAGIDPSDLVPPLTNPTIGDRLNAARVSWKWYSGGWDNALAGNPAPLFQFHHQPFAYYQNYGDGTQLKAEHLVDLKQLKKDLTGGTLPNVVFIKQIGQDNEHPGYSSLLKGQTATQEIVNQIKGTPYWKNTVIIITYDENGGRWDHVAPPVIDRWGPGTRVPAIIISPLAKRHYVDHTQYETASILAFIERRYNLKPLGTRDAAANPFSNAFTFSF